MNKISSLGISAAIIAVLLIFAAITNSVLAAPAMPSNQTKQQMMSQLFSGKNVKIGNVTLGLRPGIMAMPLMCMTFSGHLSGLPTSMAKNMNQSSMMALPGMQGNQSSSWNELGAMMMRSGMIPSVCFPMSDATLFGSMMMHGGSMNGMMSGGNMTAGSTMMGGGK